MPSLPNRFTCLMLGSLVIVVAGGALFLQTDPGQAALGYVRAKVRGGYTVEQRLELHGPDVSARLAPRFAAAGVPYPPTELAFLAFKDSRQLEVYARAAPADAWVRVVDYPILGLSGQLGPKLREGDRQVPEGIYKAEFLNANSRFHLAIRLNYPNAFDLARAAEDGRTHVGSDIMIHGTAASAGCLAVGNRAAEELFILAANAGKEQVSIIVAPTDLRRAAALRSEGAPEWVDELYRVIQSELAQYP